MICSSCKFWWCCQRRNVIKFEAFALVYTDLIMLERWNIEEKKKEKEAFGLAVQVTCSSVNSKQFWVIYLR